MPFESSRTARVSFKHVEPVGKGKFGVVYRAFSMRFYCEVAVKEIAYGRGSRDESLRARARVGNEAGIFETLGDRPCEQIVRYFARETDQDHGEIYVYLEFVPGGTLAEALRARRLDLGEALSVAGDIVRAIDFHWARKVVHRDIKPSNVLLVKRDDGSIVGAKLTDYGLGEVLGVDSAYRTSQAYGLPPGTKGYLSPEQRSQQDYLSAASDLYNVGLLLWEMLTGQPRFLTPLEPVDTGLRDFPTLVPIVEKALRSDPASRYNTPRELLDALSRATTTLQRPDPARTEPRTAAGAPPLGHLSRALNPGAGALVQPRQALDSELLPPRRLTRSAPAIRTSPVRVGAASISVLLVAAAMTVGPGTMLNAATTTSVAMAGQIGRLATSGLNASLTPAGVRVLPVPTSSPTISNTALLPTTMESPTPGMVGLLPPAASPTPSGVGAPPSYTSTPEPTSAIELATSIESPTASDVSVPTAATSSPVPAIQIQPASGSWSLTGSLSATGDLLAATLLPNGKVLVSGGSGGTVSPPYSAELYDPTSGAWSPTGNLNTARVNFTATLLPNGKVLVVGGAGAELYDPASGAWRPTGKLNVPRWYHIATLLPNGKVLIAGGYSGSLFLASAEIYDPSSGSWKRTGDMGTARESHTATLLQNGRVLVAGGEQGGIVLNSAELYDPASGRWSQTPGMLASRADYTATLLRNGTVLVAGGIGSGTRLNSAEIYDPASGRWRLTGSMNAARQFHTATLLPSENVLVVGGVGTGGILNSAEVYDSSSGTWTPTGDMNVAREYHTATLLPTGRVLVTAGDGPSGILNSAELFDPTGHS